MTAELSSSLSVWTDLIQKLITHAAVGLVADGKDVRRQLVQIHVLIDADVVVGVYIKFMIRVD